LSQGLGQPIKDQRNIQISTFNHPYFLTAKLFPKGTFVLKQPVNDMEFYYALLLMRVETNDWRLVAVALFW
jgi:hypothetical protein